RDRDRRWHSCLAVAFTSLRRAALAGIRLGRGDGLVTDERSDALAADGSGIPTRDPPHPMDDGCGRPRLYVLFRERNARGIAVRLPRCMRVDAAPGRLGGRGRRAVRVGI